MSNTYIYTESCTGARATCFSLMDVCGSIPVIGQLQLVIAAHQHLCYQVPRHRPWDLSDPVIPCPSPLHMSDVLSCSLTTGV